jgi:hypothetical protein
MKVIMIMMVCVMKWLIGLSMEGVMGPWFSKGVDVILQSTMHISSKTNHTQSGTIHSVF